jgi:hypothetical protein
MAATQPIEQFDNEVQNYSWTIMYSNGSFYQHNIAASSLQEAKKLAIDGIKDNIKEFTTKNIVKIKGSHTYLVDLFTQNSKDDPYGVMRYKNKSENYMQTDIPQDADIMWFINNTIPKLVPVS